MSSLIGTKPHQVPMNGALGRLAFLDHVGLADIGTYIPKIISDTSISPTTEILFVSGTTDISIIVPPVTFTNGGMITIIPTSKFNLAIGGNIAVAVSAEVGKPIYLTYAIDTTNSANTLWYPSYSTTVNRVTVTAPATGSTLTIADGKTLTANRTLTLAGTDSKTLTINKSITLDGTDSKTLSLNSSLTFNTVGNNSETVTFNGTGTVVYVSSPTVTGTATVNGNLVVNSNNVSVGVVPTGTIAASGTVGSITGTGTPLDPWIATISAMPTTIGFIVGASVSATAGNDVVPANNGTIFGGSPTSTEITSVSVTSITYKVVGGTIPTAGKIINITSAATNISANGGGITIKGTTDKTFTWNLTDNAWVSSIGLMTGSSLISAASWTTGGINLKLKARTYTDNSTAASATVATRYINVIEASTLASTNAITVTDAVNLFVSAPIAGTNSTLTNRWSILTDGNVKITSTTASTSASTGALVVGGGAGIGGKLFVTGDIKIAATTVSTSATTGALVVGGGVGIGEKLFVIGDIASDGNVTAYNSSDKRLKENITPITSPIDKLLKLSGNTFKWTSEYYATQNQSLVKEFDIGVVAQEVQEVLPEAVHERDNGMLAVDYQKLIPLLIECIKEQQNQINELRGIK